MIHGYIPFGQYFVTSITTVNKAKFAANGNGAFIVSCHTHCEAQGGGFDTFKIGQTSMMQAVSDWMTANSNAPAPAADHSFVDCFYSATGTHVCNPTC